MVASTRSHLQKKKKQEDGKQQSVETSVETFAVKEEGNVVACGWNDEIVGGPGDEWLGAEMNELAKPVYLFPCVV